MNKEFVPSEQWGWTASSHLQCSRTKGVATLPDRLPHSPSTPTSGPACTPLLAGQSPDDTQAVVSCDVAARLDVRVCVFHIISRLLKACGSRLTEKLLEGAPTEDTLVLIERQTGSHVVFHQTGFCNGNLCVSHCGRCSNMKLNKGWRWKTVKQFILETFQHFLPFRQGWPLEGDISRCHVVTLCAMILSSKLSQVWFTGSFGGHDTLSWFFEWLYWNTLPFQKEFTNF